MMAYHNLRGSAVLRRHEWASNLAITLGGRSKGYGDAPVSSPRAYRPGMALFHGHEHAMIILDIYRDASVSPALFQVAEANNRPANMLPRGVVGMHWNDPEGMAPWTRTVRTDRVVDPAKTPAPGLVVVEFEAP